MITNELIQKHANFNRDEYGVYDEEFAELELRDFERKGCIIEHIPYCQNCPYQMGGCPLSNWKDCHPEFVDDELDRRIRNYWKNACS